MEDAIVTLGQVISYGMVDYFAVFVALVISFWLKDFVAAFVKGIAFRFNPTFQEGDKVILDNERALIVKIGLTQTVFGIRKTADGKNWEYCWRYVPNTMIQNLKLEKVIYGHDPAESDHAHRVDPRDSSQG